VSLHLRLLLVCKAVTALLDELLLSLLCCCRNEGQGVLCQTQQSVAPVGSLMCRCLAEGSHAATAVLADMLLQC
jgi:hypothetical protein